MKKVHDRRADAILGDTPLTTLCRPVTAEEKRRWRHSKPEEPKTLLKPVVKPTAN